MDLNETYVVPSFRRNLVSISILDKFGYTCSFGNNKFSLFQNSNLFGTGSLYYVDNLYMLDTVSSYHETLQLSTQGVKRKLTDENSSSLWHKRLGHISKRRIERLVSDGILDSLDFVDFEICTNCIKGKQTNTRRFGANRATDVLQLIHRAGNLSPARWVSPTNPKLGPGWALIFLALKNRAKFSPTRLACWAKHYWIGLARFFSGWLGLKN